MCPTHYQQERRGTPLRPVREPMEEAAQVVFRCPSELKERAEAAASAAGVDAAEWWRRVGESALKRRTR